MKSIRGKLEQVTVCLLVGKGRVKEPVEQRLRHPKAHLLPVNGMKAISHTPDRDRVLPIVPGGTSKMEGGRQRERNRDGGSRKQLKKVDKEREHKSQP